MNIVIFEAKPRDKVFFKKHCAKDSITFVTEALTTENAKKYARAEIVSVFVFSKISKETLTLLPKLRVIATRSTGYDHINTIAAKKRNVLVCNVPQYGSNTVAEHTFALILNLSRNVHKSYVRAQNENYEIEDLVGFDLKDKWLGVIGAGKIGQHVIKIAKGFGMHVIAYDEHKDHFLADLLHFSYAQSIEEVLEKADIVTLHVPSLPSTKHLINKERLAHFKKGALLINTSRGDVVDTEALYNALKEKKLGGAGLDVIEGEQYVKEDRELLAKQDIAQMQILLESKKILKMDNVVFTPHNAFNSKEALHRILEETIRNIAAYKMGKPVNLVR
jgi:D-lactate dehydrogenase